MASSENFILIIIIGLYLSVSGCAQPVSDNPGLAKFSEYTFTTSNHSDLICEYYGTENFLRHTKMPHFTNLSLMSTPIKITCSKDYHWDKIIILTPLRTFNLLDRLVLGQNVTLQNAVYTKASVGRVAGLPRKLHIVLRRNSFKNIEERDLYYAQEVAFVEQNWDKILSKLEENCQNTKSDTKKFSSSITSDACQKAKKQISKLRKNDLMILEVQRRGSQME